MTKDYPEIMKWSRLLSFLEDYPLVHVATIDDDRPHVRMMALILYENKLWLTTQTHWNKVEEIAKNNNVELSVGIRGQKGNGAARISGKAVRIDDYKIRKSLSEVIPWFVDYWSSYDSEQFCLYRIDPNRALVDHPDNRLKYHVDEF